MPRVIFEDQYLGDETIAQLFDRCGGDSLTPGSKIKYNAFNNCRKNEEDFASTLSEKTFRYSFVCVDQDLDDYLTLEELTNMLDNGLGGTNEATIEATAFATDDELS
jgi:hypothetical protein